MTVGVGWSTPHPGHFTYLLTPWCRVLLEKLTGLQLFKKFPAFHGTQRFITALTSVRHLSLSWAIPIQSIYPHPTSWRSILMLSTHICLGHFTLGKGTGWSMPPPGHWTGWSSGRSVRLREILPPFRSSNLSRSSPYPGRYTDWAIPPAVHISTDRFSVAWSWTAMKMQGIRHSETSVSIYISYRRYATLQSSLFTC